MWQRAKPWLFPIFSLTLVIVVFAGYVYTQRPTRRRIPEKVDSSFLQNESGDAVTSASVSLPSFTVSEEVQDPFFAGNPCFAYIESACQKVLSVSGSGDNRTLQVTGAVPANMSTATWAFVYGKQYLPIFPVYDLYLDTHKDDFEAYIAYRNFTANLNSQVTGSQISPVFFFAYINFLMEARPGDYSFQRQIVSKSIVLVDLLEQSDEVLKAASFADENISTTGRLFIAITQIVFGEDLTAEIFNDKGNLESYYLNKFSSDSTPVEGVPARRGESVGSPTRLRELILDTPNVTSFCDGEETLVCTFTNQEAVCHSADWLQPLCKINIYQR